jgi:hypothetical protein
MSLAIQDFWKLAIASRAITLDEAKSLHATFTRTPGAAKANSPTLAEWLIDGGVLTRYQARQLLSGNPSPLVLGEYRIIDLIQSGPLAELHRVIHTSTGQQALLYFCDAGAAEGSDWPAVQQQAATKLSARYPRAGRIFGMAEVEGRRFLVLEDNSASVSQFETAATVTTSSTPTARSPQSAAITAAAAVSNRPVLVPKKVPVRSVDQPVVIDTHVATGVAVSTSPMSAYVKRRRSNTPVIVGLGVAAIAVIAVAAMLLPSSQSVKEPKTAHAIPLPPPADKTPPAGDSAPSKAPSPRKNDALAIKEVEPPIVDAAIEVADDGQSLWISPTHGPPVDLRYLANGGQLFLVIRPSSLLGNEEGERVFDVLGPRALAGRDFVQQATGFELMDIERLLVAFYPNEGQPLDVAIVVTLREPTSKDVLLQAWHDPKETGTAKKFYQGSPWAYYIPPTSGGRTFAVMPVKLMNEMLTMDGPPLFRKELEKLLRDTDDTRHLTLLGYPNFLFADGALLLSGDLAKLKAPLLEYLGEGVQAASFSMHLGTESFFTELRVWGTLDHNGYDLAQAYRTRLNEFPDRIESYLATLTPSNYGRLVLTRMPRMIGQFANFTRIGEENSQAVLRCYLPVTAAHNLALATELALSEGAGGAAVAVSSPAKPPATLAEALQRKISLSFPRNTLEKCMEMIGEELGYPVHIEGADLQLEGITKNQSFGLDERGKPADEILRKVMLLANPDGKLVYVLKPLEPGGADVVFVTTRAAAAKRGDKLPPELEQTPRKK